MNKIPKKRMLRARRSVVPLFLLAGVLVLASIGIAVAATTTFYLQGAGVPFGSLGETVPSAGSLPNYDPGRDDAPGLLLSKGGEEHETDPTKHQVWLAAEGELALDGPVTLMFWSAMKDFNTEKKGHVEAYLLDCDRLGMGCLTIASADRRSNPWNEETGWVARSLDFGTVTHMIAADRALGVELVVTNQAHDDMWVAYDTALYASALSVGVTSPPPTTTTTTTTAQPPPTTAQPPITTTTTAPRTTTRPPITTTTTSTSATQPPTTTPSPPTTTIAFVVGEEVPPKPTAPDDTLSEEDPSEGDVALNPLPHGGDESQPGLSGGFLDSLDLVVPPAVTSSLLSPLLLLKSILGAFLATGRELLIPGLLLVVGVMVTADRRRRDISLTLADQVEAQQ